MISKKDILYVHRNLVDQYGGTLALRDEQALNFAIKRPYESFGGRAFFESPEEKAAILVERLLIDRPFEDHNQRIAYVMLRLLLRLEGKDITASALEKQSLILHISQGKLRFEGILAWIKDKLNDTTS